MNISEDQRLKEITDWLDRYVRSFEDGDEKNQRVIGLKKDHTFRVRDEILGIGRQLRLSVEELRLAAVAALLHDVGRFEQYARYRTFVDGRSGDHAKLGVRILKQHDVLKGFNDRDKTLILCAIEWHNRASLPREEPESSLFLVKLLRDADKLDIWRVVTDYYRLADGAKNNVVELDLPDSPGVSDAVCSDLMNKRIVDIRHVKNLNDFKLLQVGWIFDINFGPTFEGVRERRYLEMIRDALPRTDQIEEIFDVALRHLRAHSG